MLRCGVPVRCATPHGTALCPHALRCTTPQQRNVSLTPNHSTLHLTTPPQTTTGVTLYRFQICLTPAPSPCVQSVIPRCGWRETTRNDSLTTNSLLTPQVLSVWYVVHVTSTKCVICVFRVCICSPHITPHPPHYTAQHRTTPHRSTTREPRRRTARTITPQRSRNTVKHAGISGKPHCAPLYWHHVFVCVAVLHGAMFVGTLW